MFRKKIKAGDLIRQKTTGDILRVDFARDDVFVCRQNPAEDARIVSINDVEVVRPSKNKDRLP